MSVLTVGGRRFAAGLYWLEREGAASVARNARAFKRPWHVHWGEQTGYAADEESPKGCPSLAASLQGNIGTPTWMALVEADDGRLALVKARDGAFLADGDEVFADREAALAAFERARGETNSSRGPEGSSVAESSTLPESSSVPVSSTVPESSSVGWALHATPGLVKDAGAGRSPVLGSSPVSEVEPASLADDPAMRLAAAPLSMLGLPRVGRFLALAVMVAGGAFVWTQRGTLWDLIAGSEEAAEAEQAPLEPPVTAILDAGALLAGCRQALMAYPPYMPAWRTERISCEGRFADIALIGVRPELKDRAGLTVRWRLGSGRPEPLHRRIAETHLSDWYAASVTGDRAWGAIPLAPVLQRFEVGGEHHGAPPSLLDFREAVDRHFGTRGTRIEYPIQGDGIEVRVTTGRVPFRLADAVSAIPGLELVRLIRDGAGEWRLEGRRVSPVSMPRERFQRVAQPVTQPPAKLEGAAAGTADDSAGSAVNHTANDGGSGS